MPGPQHRFDRQTRFAPLGTAGQQRLETSRVLILGTGALGGVLAQNLVRSGIGQVVLADRDSVAWSNLPRQVLFEERHAREAAPKALAAKETLQRIGGPSQIEAFAVHVDADNLPDLAAGAHLVLDGTDNLETRYLLNDYCVRSGVPWVYAGVVGGGGLVLAIRPGQGPCLRCLFPEPPPAGSLETCDTAGVLMPAVGAVASIASGLALRLLVAPEDLQAQLIEVDVWRGSTRSLPLPRNPDCPACVRGEFPFLDTPLRERSLTLCGRNTVQVRGRGESLDLDAMAQRLRAVDSSAQNIGPFVRATLDGLRVTLFRDGRALLEGTDDAGRALSVYDRYLA
ncbi:MAG: ThiF family adenylyltransferase [Planctomycetota bacterium]